MSTINNHCSNKSKLCRSGHNITHSPTAQHTEYPEAYNSTQARNISMFKLKKKWEAIWGSKKNSSLVSILKPILTFSFTEKVMQCNIISSLVMSCSNTMDYMPCFVNGAFIKKIQKLMTSNSGKH